MGLNQDIEHVETWKALQSGNSGILHRHLHAWFTALYGVAVWLAPFLPETSERMKTLLTAQPVTAVQPLFPRLQH